VSFGPLCAADVRAQDRPTADGIHTNSQLDIRTRFASQARDLLHTESKAETISIIENPLTPNDSV
jgi:hypothetical protein